MKALFYNGSDYVIAESEADAVKVWEKCVGGTYEPDYDPFEQCSDYHPITIQFESGDSNNDLVIPLQAWKKIRNGVLTYQATAKEWVEVNEPQILCSENW